MRLKANYAYNVDKVAKLLKPHAQYQIISNSITETLFKTFNLLKLNDSYFKDIANSLHVAQHLTYIPKTLSILFK